MVHCPAAQRRMLLFQKISENLRHGTTNLAISADRTATRAEIRYILSPCPKTTISLSYKGSGECNQACLAPLSDTNLACHRTREQRPARRTAATKGSPGRQAPAFEGASDPSKPLTCPAQPQEENTLRVQKLASLANSSRHCSDPLPLRPPSPPSRRVPR